MRMVTGAAEQHGVGAVKDARAGDGPGVPTATLHTGCVCTQAIGRGK